MNEKEYIKKCQELIEERFTLWGNLDTWKEGEFKKLSDKIYEQTNISISFRTLKRFFGKEKISLESYQPQDATKNALALFLGYKDWDDFIITYTTNNTVKKKSKSYKYPIILFSIFIFCIIFFLILKNFHQNINTDTITFSANYTSGITPNTVVFHYDYSKSAADSVIIDYGDGMKQYLPKNKKTITYCYIRSGYYSANLQINHKNIKTVKIHSQSKDWLFYVSLKNEDKLKQLFFNDSVKDGILHLDPKDIEASKLTEKEYWLYFRNIKNFEATGDNFTLIMRAKNDPKEGGINCFNIIPELYCENGNILVTFINKGCFRWVYLQLNEKFIDGQYEDLSRFSYDLLDWHIFKIHVKNKKASIYFDNKLIYKNFFLQDAGKIKGLNITFRGSGSIDYIKLLNQSDSVIYNNDF